MAKKYSLGGMLFFGAVTAALGGIAAYRHRKSIEDTIQDIADQLEAQEEDGFFSVDLEDLEEDPIVHHVSPAQPSEDPEPLAQETPADPE